MCIVLIYSQELSFLFREVSELPDDQSISFEERKRRVNDRSLRELLPVC